ncbi:hypothetical protein DPSP01_006724 [Paraphaeosphaeria sporulosa]
MHCLVNDIGSPAAVQYRLVCKNFAVAIKKDLLQDQSVIDTFGGLNEVQKVRLLIRHRGAMHANRTGTAANVVTRLAKQMTDEIVTAGYISPEDIGTKAIAYVCEAQIAGVKFLVEHGTEVGLDLGGLNALQVAMRNTRHTEFYEDVASYLREATASANRMQRPGGSGQFHIDDAGLLMDLLPELPAGDASLLLGRIRKADYIAGVTGDYREYHVAPQRTARKG